MFMADFGSLLESYKLSLLATYNTTMCNTITYIVMTAIFHVNLFYWYQNLKPFWMLVQQKTMSLSRHVQNHLHLDPVKSPPPSTSTQAFYRPDAIFLAPNQQCQNTESNIIKRYSQEKEKKMIVANKTYSINTRD